jgi:hypothetical protein
MRAGNHNAKADRRIRAGSWVFASAFCLCGSEGGRSIQAKLSTKFTDSPLSYSIGDIISLKYKNFLFLA